ncbi:MAG TPA: chromate resistance protein ChrB domain-containing protein [Gemmatimonadaceae bacterium]|nr:chromate resistance protein ChrB domain-containing protein [Gemmatimonadaceae bacterium]
MKATRTASPEGGARWLLLIHQLPPEPAYIRVKVRRRLQKLGAVPLKNSVYVLSETDAHLEDFQWLASEIVGDGGEATICSAVFVGGTTDTSVRKLLAKGGIAAAAKTSRPAKRPRGALWVTRADVFVDRMASAWLIRRFIDARARFRFVDQKAYRRRNKELRFDMYGGEFTHVGDQCTFEVLVQHFGLSDDAGLCAIGEVVHDLDLKDAKFRRREAPRLLSMLERICASTADDMARVEQSRRVFDDLYNRLGRRRSTKRKREIAGR